MPNSVRRPTRVSAEATGVSRGLTAFAVALAVAVAVIAGTVTAAPAGTANGGVTNTTGVTDGTAATIATGTASVSACSVGSGTGTVTVDVYSHDGSEVEDGEAYLFERSSYDLAREREFTGGQVTFQDTDLGAYNLEVYTDDGEFLGVTGICHDGYTITEYRAISPSLVDVDYDERAGDEDGVIEPDEGVLVSPKVDNDEGYELEVRTEITYEGATETRGPEEISDGGTEWYGAQFGVDDGGEKDVTVEVYANYGGGWQLTHEVDRELEVDEAPTSDREEPDDDDVDAVVGESVTFEVDAEDDDELGGAEWYVDGQFQTQHRLSGDDDTDEYTVTFDSAGEYVVGVDVYDDEGRTYNDDAAVWTVDVDEPVTYDLSTASGDGGSVSVSPDESEYRDGETVTLTAESDANFEFDHWSGDVPDDEQDDRQIDLEMDEDRFVRAVFTRGEGAVKLDVQHQNGDRAQSVNAILVRHDGELVREVVWPDDDFVSVPRTFDDLEAGKQYQFEVYINDQFAATESVTVDADETRDVTVDVENPVWIRPEVVDAAGEPLEGASVAVYSHEYDQNDGDRVVAWRGGETDDRGYVETPNDDGRLWLHPDDQDGYYVIVVTRDGDQIAEETVDGLTGNREVTVETSATSVDPAVERWTQKEATSDDGQIAVGERTAIGVTLRNDGTEMPLRTVFQFDTDGDGEPEAVDVNGDGQPDRVDFDGDGDAEPGTVRGDVEETDVPAGATEPFGLKFSPSQAGNWQVRAVMQAYPNGEWVNAGTTDWDGFDVVGTEESAEIVDSETTLPSGTFGPGEDVTATVTVQNTGTVEETFYVGYTATHRDSGTAYDVAAEEVTLPPGATREVSLTWTVPEVPQTGKFGVTTAVWLDSTDEGLVGRQDDATGTVTVEAGSVVTIVNHDPQEDTTTTTQVKREDESYPFESASPPTDRSSIDNRNLPPTDGVTNITESEQYPWTAVGQVRGQNSSLALFSCTGTVIEDNHVLTAAHCIYEEDGGDFLDNLYFQPAKNGHEAPLPSYSVEHVQVYESYSSDNAPVQRDVAVLTLEQPIADETGTFAFDTFSPSSDVYGDGLRLVGYPSREEAEYVNVDNSLWHIGLNGKKFGTIADCTGKKCLLAGSKIIGEFSAKGNSGGPSWRVVEDEPHVIGVHHGVGGFPERTIQVRITPGKYSDIGKMVERGNEVALPPIVSLDVPETVVPGETVTLDASESFDPDGEIDYYKWSLDQNEDDFEKRTDGPRLETELQQNPGSPVRVKAVGEDGRTETVSVYVDFRAQVPNTPEFQNRAVYIWGYADDLARDAAARERFLSRADEQNLNTVFLSWGTLSTATPEQRATLLRALDDNGIQTHAMVGAAGPNAIQTTRDTVPEILAYNADRPAVEQFDGLHLDAEPGEADLQPFLDDYQTLLSDIETGIAADGETVRSQELAVSSAIGWWWDQSDQAPEATDELVDSSALDYVVVMAYYDEASEVRDRTAKITDETDTPYVVAVETQEFPADGTTERVSFYEEGLDAATGALDAIADDPPREGHRGGALHFYQSAVATWDSLRGGATPDEIAHGETGTVEPNVVFDDSFPQSSHRSQLVVEFRGPEETYTVRETVTPPGAQLTATNVDWTPPSDAATGEYTVVATLRDTTVENSNHQAIKSREPVTLDTERLGTVTVTEGDEPGNGGDGNEPPALELDAPDEVTVGEQARFDAEVIDPDGDDDAVTYDWSVRAADDGTPPEPNDAGATRLTFTEPGSYEVSVTATDAGGATATVTAEVTVDPDPTPTATLGVDDDTTRVGETVTFDASASDTPGSVSYEWDFDGDGRVDRTTDEPTVEHTYDTASEYTATVTVVGSDGESDTAEVDVTVREDESSESPETRDVARLSAGATATATSTGSYAGYVAAPERAIDDEANRGWGGTRGAGDELTVDLGQTYAVDVIGVDLEYHSLTYDVEVSTDGTEWTTVVDDQRTEGNHYVDDEARTREQFQMDGRAVRYVRIHVESTNAPASHIWQAMIENVTVLPATDAGQEPPSAALTVDSPVTAGTQVTFDASDSTSSTAVTRYEWDFDGDGTTDRTTDGPTTTYSYDSADVYDATVTVVAGETSDTTTATVDVTEPDDPTPPPQTDPEAGTDTVTAGDSVTLDAEATDGDGDGDLRYNWAQVAGPDAELSVGDTATPTLTAPEVSQRRTVRYRVTVTDGDTGVSATGTVAVTVVPADTGDAPYAATRNVDGPVAPGETATVTVEVDVRESVDALALDAKVGDGTLARNTSTPPATYRPGEAQWLWLSADAGTRTVTYDVRVPADADPGTEISLSGTISADGQPAVTVTGDDAIRVRECPAAVAAGDDRTFSLQEIQQLVGTWASDEPVAGEVLGLQRVQGLIGAWADDERVACGGGE